MKKTRVIHWSQLEFDHWRIHVAATEQGLCYVGSHGAPLKQLITWSNKYLPDYTLIQNEHLMQRYVTELSEYFAGEREQFTLPMQLHGTAFQQEVWQALQDIPYGETVSYSEIAGRIQRPSAVRAVGTAIGTNPIAIVIPCHRVIGKNGQLTGYRGGLEMKKQLLALEKQQ